MRRQNSWKLCKAAGRAVSIFPYEILDLGQRASGKVIASCPDCGKTFMGRVISGPQRLLWVIVPPHPRRRTVITKSPKAEYL